MKKIVIPAILAATVLVAGMFAVMPVQKASTIHTTIIAAVVGKRLVGENAMLNGLPSLELFPFVDTTPHHILSAHITITDATSSCVAGDAAPTNVAVAVGIAGGILINVMGASTNTGIGSTTQCVFHITVTPGTTIGTCVTGCEGPGTVPTGVTDIVVKNISEGALTAVSTIEVSADVDNS